jgi:hypothetical protein
VAASLQQPPPSLTGADRKSLDPLLILIGAIGVIGAALVIVGAVLKRSH